MAINIQSKILFSNKKVMIIETEMMAINGKQPKPPVILLLPHK